MALVMVACEVTTRRPVRRGLRRFLVVTLLLSGFFYAATGPTPGHVHLGPLNLAGADFTIGLVAGLRLTLVAYAASLGMRFVPVAQLLPYVARGGILAYLAGTILRLGAILRHDARRLQDAQQARGHHITLHARSWIPLLVPLLVVTLRRSREQALALTLAGLQPKPRFGLTPAKLAAIATFSALAAAGRLLFVGVPSVSPSFFLVFVAGVCYGPWVGFLVGATQRLVSDLALSGLYPVFIVTVPVEALLGLASGLVGRVVNFGQREREPWPYVAALCAVAGLAYTLVFSVSVDTFSWLVAHTAFPDLDETASQALWSAFVVAGLVFNSVAAIFNACLFAVATYPTLTALRRAGLLPTRPPTPTP